MLRSDMNETTPLCAPYFSQIYGQYLLLMFHHGERKNQRENMVKHTPVIT